MPSKLHILKTVRYDRNCFHDSLNRTAVISGNEKLTEATMRKPVSSHFVYFPFRLLPCHLLPFHLLPFRLIRVLAVCMKKPKVLTYPSRNLAEFLRKMSRSRSLIFLHENIFFRARGVPRQNAKTQFVFYWADLYVT